MVNPFEEITARLSSIEAILQELRKESNHAQRTEGTRPGEAVGHYVSKRQAARMLDCSPSTIDNHARAGRLTRYYVGKAVRFDRAQVLSLARAILLPSKQK
jgi:excisionase family DNA binding protein